MPFNMDEEHFPASVLAKAHRSGNEYGWPLEAVEETIAAAQTVGLVTIGGQPQFCLPDGTCEMYWLNADATPRRLGESRDDYVRRSAEEVVSRFRALVAKTDFAKEANGWGFLREKMEAGVNVTQYLRFILYFDAGKS